MTGTPCARVKSVDRSSDDETRRKRSDTMRHLNLEIERSVSCDTGTAQSCSVIAEIRVFLADLAGCMALRVALKEILFRCNVAKR